LAAADETTRLSSLLAQLPALTHLLDLGCGICADVPTYFAAGAQRICAVDWDRIALRAARRIHRSKALCLIYGDVRTIAFAPQAFDAILIRHPDIERAPLDLADSAGARAALAEAHRQALADDLQPDRTIRVAQHMPRCALARRAARRASLEACAAQRTRLIRAVLARSTHNADSQTEDRTQILRRLRLHSVEEHARRANA
jgi:hypothetical protein